MTSLISGFARAIARAIARIPLARHGSLSSRSGYRDCPQHNGFFGVFVICSWYNVFRTCTIRWLFQLHTLHVSGSWWDKSKSEKRLLCNFDVIKHRLILSSRAPFDYPVMLHESSSLTKNKNCSKEKNEPCCLPALIEQLALGTKLSIAEITDILSKNVDRLLFSGNRDEENADRCTEDERLGKLEDAPVNWDLMCNVLWDQGTMIWYILINISITKIWQMQYSAHIVERVLNFEMLS